MPHNGMDQKAIAEFIRQARMRAGLTIEQLAELAKLSLSTVKNAEHARGNVSEKTLISFQRVLGTYFLTLQDSNNDAQFLINNQEVFDIRRLLRDIRRQCLNGRISVEYLCITRDSTEKYFAAQLDNSYYDIFLRAQLLHIYALIGKIINLCKGSELELVALTCGHGWIDIDFAYQISVYAQKIINLFIVNPSPHLFSKFVDHYTSCRYDESLVLLPVMNRHDRFSLLPRCNHSKRRVFCIFGTLVNYDLCDSVLSNLSKSASPGDFLLLDLVDVQTGKTTEKNRHNPHVFDYRLNGEIPFSEQTLAYLNATITGAINWKEDLSKSSVALLPSSSPFNKYSIDLRFTSYDENIKTDISALIINRLSAPSLINYLATIGWALIEHYPVAQDNQLVAKTSMLLFIHK